MRLKYSEIFYSLQGEGRFVGAPSVFLRAFGCNFTCRGFGQPGPPERWLPPERMPDQTQDLAGITSLDDLPVPTVGCDSSPSWSPRFRHLAPVEDLAVIARRLVEIAPAAAGWRAPSGEDVHLVITGGEPLLWQRAWPALLGEPPLAPLRNLTFETNGTQPLQPEFEAFLARRSPELHLTWSVSPKLSRSGEPWAEAIRPEVIAQYSAAPNRYLYLKFVVTDEADFAEAEAAAAAYRAAGARIDALYAMPEGGLMDRYDRNRARVAELCLARGFRYSPRLHIDLFGNRFGT